VFRVAASITMSRNAADEAASILDIVIAILVKMLNGMVIDKPNI